MLDNNSERPPFETTGGRFPSFPTRAIRGNEGNMELPNRYRQLVQAGQSLTGGEILGRAETASEAETAAFLESNQAALNFAHGLLGEKCQVPVEFGAFWLEQHYSDFGAL